MVHTRGRWMEEEVRAAADTTKKKFRASSCHLLHIVRHQNRPGFLSFCILFSPIPSARPIHAHILFIRSNIWVFVSRYNGDYLARQPLRQGEKAFTHSPTRTAVVFFLPAHNTHHIARWSAASASEHGRGRGGTGIECEMTQIDV